MITELQPAVPAGSLLKHLLNKRGTSDSVFHSDSLNMCYQQIAICLGLNFQSTFPLLLPTTVEVDKIQDVFPGDMSLGTSGMLS